MRDFRYHRLITALIGWRGAVASGTSAFSTSHDLNISYLTSRFLTQCLVYGL
jgi:hypothetical protein